MCGRYSLSVDPATIFEVFGSFQDARGDGFEPRFNIAPAEPPLPAGSKRKSGPRETTVPVLRRHPPVDEPAGASAGASLQAINAVWPLIPGWARGEVPKYSTANARSETMAEKNSFKPAWTRGQRCLIPATGFIEWQSVGDDKAKQPWHVRPLNEPFFLFGGLWESSKNQDKTWVMSCTIVTMAANPLMRTIHNAGRNRHRMPLMLDHDAARTWLAGSITEAAAMITPFPADEMVADAITTRINNPNAEGAELLTALPEPP